jgi:hypothetical protein
MALECRVQALIAHDAAGTDALGELFSLDSVLFAFGAIGGIEQ